MSICAIGCSSLLRLIDSIRLAKCFVESIAKRHPAITKQQCRVLAVDSLLPALGEKELPKEKVVLWKGTPGALKAAGSRTG